MDEAGRFVSIIGAVREPLGFFTLIALILDGALIAAGVANKLSLILPVAVLALLILTVAAMALWRPQALYPPGSWSNSVLTVTILFTKSTDTNLTNTPDGTTDTLTVQECSL